MNIDFTAALDYLDSKQEQIRRAEQRQLKFWRREKLPVPLYFLGGKLPEAVAGLPDPDYLQAASDPQLMLAAELRKAMAALEGQSDLVPSIRPNLGCGVVLACLGLEQEFYPDKMPWLHSHLTLAEAQKLDIDRVEIRGTFARGIDMMKYFVETLGGRLSVYPMDTQGPFDLAHLLAGDEIFLAMFDDPDAVHHLMEFCTALLEKLIRAMKQAIGEPLTVSHYQNLYSKTFGIRICEDTTALLGPDQIAEFAMSYSRRLAEAFGGAYCHYCGRNDELTAAQLAEPAFKVLNFGQIPGKPELHDFQEEMAKFTAAGKPYFGNWPRLAGESYPAYLERLYPYMLSGILLPTLDQPPLDYSRSQSCGFMPR